MSRRLGIDIGGTFTDFALIDDATGRLAVHKRLTTPDDPSCCVIEGIEAMLSDERVDLASVASIVHGTTLVTNAIIERRGARTGMLVTAGFRDVLDVALERRFDLFDLALRFADPLVPRELRLEVTERVRHDGSVERELDEDAVRAGVRALVEEEGVDALAVCFLHSYANPAHESRAAEIARESYSDLHVSTSADVQPFMREYERWTTTTANAYTQPLFDRYVARIEHALAERGFRGAFLVMTSSGGALPTEVARRYPVRLVESGPAAGVLVAAWLGEEAGISDLLSFDMGGTTAKGAIVRDGRPEKRYALEVARVYRFTAGSGLPLGVPVIDMIEIGAGGGSIAGVDERGLLAVGPRSAGADPGPACYARGGEDATLTDANVTLGYLVPERFLGGTMRLDAGAAERAIAGRVAAPLGTSTVRAAWGVHEVINEEVAGAFRAHASELGFDYRRCTMVAFGGSGPAHAVRIARKLRIPRVVFPARAGVASAIGMLICPIGFETLRTERRPLASLGPENLAAGFAPLVERALEFLAVAGAESGAVRIERRLDMRYEGQGYEVEVELPRDVDDAASVARLPELFAAAYAKAFSRSRLDLPLEVVNWKVEAHAARPRLARAEDPSGDVRREPVLDHAMLFAPDEEDFVECPIYDRYALAPGASVAGPALVQEDESTVVLGRGDRALVDARLNLVCELERGAS